MAVEISGKWSLSANGALQRRLVSEVNDVKNMKKNEQI
jgi:hypothetical protein